MTTNIQPIVANTDNFTVLFDRINEVINSLNTIVVTTDGSNTTITGVFTADTGLFNNISVANGVITVLTGNTVVYSSGTINALAANTLSVSANAIMNAVTATTVTVSSAFTGNTGSFANLTIGGNTVWTSGNDGENSGLDSDLLDGQHGSYYANVVARLGYTPLNEAGFTGSAILTKLISVDGANSNLDADFLDGQHGSYYRNADNLNAGTVPAARMGNTTTYTVGGLVSNGTLSGYSDIRLKKKIETIANALEKVKQLRGVYFEMNDQKMLGVIAQELREIIPEAVIENDDYLAVTYGNLVGLLIEAIKDVDARLTLIEDRLYALENK